MTKSKCVIASIIILMILTGVTMAKEAYKTGETYFGFKLIEKRFVSEVNAECFYFEHIKSGARLLKIAADDANKTFSVAFKTVPESDCGTPHIMEHSVLNGSKHFPVKSPFDVLAKGSLNTFLNAMTGSDITIYPVASMNDKDFFNLMHVYLDAVFYPLIYDDQRILKQEGWHHELTSPDDAVVYKGVVYNEMKGAFSSPTRELSYQVYKRLFPENGYGYSSGGYPRAIPTLTHEAFQNFHRKYYHPTNSHIFLYGDADLDKELAFIDEKYLANFEKADVRPSIPLQKPFEKMEEAISYYPVAEDGKTENQTYLTMSFVAGLNTDRALVMALDVLADVLVNLESAPIRLALQEAGIGREVRASLDDIQQNVFQIRVQNANSGDKDKFHEIVMETLKKTIKNGLDKEALEGTINRLEFRLREGDDAQKGLTYNFQALTGWFFADDPFLSLEYEKPLAKVKTALESNYLESLIEKYLLDNPHALLYVLEPKPGMEKQNKEKIASELAAFKKTLSKAEIESLVKETRELIEYQKREDSPEALATIPLLDQKDINPKAQWYDISKKQVLNTPVLHYEEFCNNVVYVKLFFDVRVLPQELIPYGSLLSEVLGSLNTENYNFGDLDNALNIHTGGFRTTLNSFLENLDDSHLLPMFAISSKAMNHKVNKLFELTTEIVDRTNYNDKDRLKAVLKRHQSRLDARVKRNGLNYAITRLNSYYDNEGMFDELTNGLEYYWFVTDLSKNFDEKFETISASLAKTASLLFTKDNLTSAVTCDKKDMPVFSDGLKNFLEVLPDGKAGKANWKFEFSKKNEGLLSASKVQYVVKGYNFKKLGYEWDGRMRVLSQVLSTDWLQNQIRVIGGAYGGFSGFSSTGQVFFGSYRDPNLTKTLENYDATPNYLKEFEADEKTMTRYIIGTVARMDRPMTPSQKGNQAVRRYFEKTTFDKIQKERDAVLATQAGDINNMAKLVADILAEEAYCVYGNEGKIKSAEGLFKEIVKLEK